LPLNWRLFVERDLVQAKMGIALEREGEEGRVYLYHNGFLQAWEYEDTTIKGKTTRAYGRQWVKILV